MTTKPFPLVERAVREVIESKYPAAANRTGGSLSYDAGSGLYVWIGLVPGGGRTDEINGQWTVDIDCFDSSYTAAMNHALGVEAALIGPRHVTSLMLLDQCVQNEAPTERPWSDDSVFRVGATYVFTARRTSSA